MQGRTVVTWLAGLICLALAGGCQTMGARGASGAGPSPSFGLSHVPAQSEPAVEEAVAGRKAASRTMTSATADDSDNGRSSATGRNRSRGTAGADPEPGPRKALPVSARTAAADDAGLDL